MIKVCCRNKATGKEVSSWHAPPSERRAHYVEEKVALVFSLKLNGRLNGKQLAAIFAAAATTIATLVITLLSQH